MQKKLTVLLSLVLAFGLAVAAQAKTTTAPKVKVTHHAVETEVVSTDVVKHTITFKTETGESTAPVQGTKARAALKKLKPAEKVTLTCKDENGEHKAITAIKTAPVTKAKAPAKAPAAAPAPAKGAAQ
jgi:hypothetical protein